MGNENISQILLFGSSEDYLTSEKREKTLEQFINYSGKKIIKLEAHLKNLSDQALKKQYYKILPSLAKIGEDLKQLKSMGKNLTSDKFSISSGQYSQKNAELHASADLSVKESLDDICDILKRIELFSEDVELVNNVEQELLQSLAQHEKVIADRDAVISSIIDEHKKINATIHQFANALKIRAVNDDLREKAEELIDGYDHLLDPFMKILFHLQLSIHSIANYATLRETFDQSILNILEVYNRIKNTVDDEEFQKNLEEQQLEQITRFLSHDVLVQEGIKSLRMARSFQKKPVQSAEKPKKSGSQWFLWSALVVVVLLSIFLWLWLKNG